MRRTAARCCCRLPRSTPWPASCRMTWRSSTSGATGSRTSAPNTSGASGSTAWLTTTAPAIDRGRADEPAPRPTPLVDREAECRELRGAHHRRPHRHGHRARGHRQVAGRHPGGPGAAPAFTDGVFYVDLALVEDLDLGLRRIAEVVGLRPSVSESAIDPLIEALRRRLLLLLDTADRVAGIGAALSAIAAGTRMTSVLVTSRAPLRIAAEHEYPLGPLASQGGRDAGPGPAVDLFLCGPAPSGRRWPSATRISRRSPRSATASTGCRSPSSWPRLAYGRSHRRPSSLA